MHKLGVVNFLKALDSRNSLKGSTRPPLPPKGESLSNTHPVPPPRRNKRTASLRCIPTAHFQPLKNDHVSASLASLTISSLALVLSPLPGE